MGDEVLRVPLARLAPWSPFSSRVWELESPITVEEVLEACQAGRLREEPRSFQFPVGNEDRLWASREERAYHVERVAFLVLHPPSDPILIDVGVPELGCHVDWIVEDGNHRHAAAIARGDDEISASIIGSVTNIRDLLGIIYPETEDAL